MNTNEEMKDAPYNKTTNTGGVKTKVPSVVDVQNAKEAFLSHPKRSGHENSAGQQCGLMNHASHKSSLVSFLYTAIQFLSRQCPI